MHDDVGRADSVAESARRFAHLRAAFGAAWARVPPLHTYIRLAGQPIRLRIAGARLAAAIVAPMRHLTGPDSGAAPGLRVDLWDAAEMGTPLPPLDGAAGRTWVLGSGRFAVSSDGRFVSHELGRSMVWLDRHERRMVGRFAGADALTLHQRGKPLQLLLALWASDRGLTSVHAALLARGRRGVLVPGCSGAGKSTVALRCLLDGFSYAGDDWVGVERRRDGTFCGHGLYASASLDPHHAQRFPTLAADAIPASASDQKHLLLLHDRFPQRLTASAEIAALALPRIVADASSRIQPAGRGDAFLTLARGTVFTLRPRAAPGDVERLGQLARQVPAWWLEIGPDLRDIAPLVDEILARAAGR